MAHEQQSPAANSDKRVEDFWDWFENGDKTDRQRGARDFEPAKPRPIGFAITGSGRRKPPTGARKKVILEKQQNRCLYCDHTFGTRIVRRGRGVTLQLNWDHFIPYAYGRTNETTNWVAACHVCNGIKSCRVFDTVTEASRFILARWIEKGYEIQRPLLSAEVSS